ncbi:MAG: AAA family ATPase [Clostridiales bacterium]|nr:AAA family ATPase [Clostridiales bacterium]MDU3240710.1 AAA family ATPase [Clostridiales bacterium]
MINFRGFSDKTIDFNDRSVVLLSAANGIGKTTTVDAIEWCLTGNIGRLKTAFDTRSTNDAERKMNTDGILKNRDAGAKAKVKVVLWLFDGHKETILCREQTKDELDPSSSKVEIDGNEELAKSFIREYVGDSFYNFHFCDVQKSFNVQSKKRKDLKDFFNEFITNYDERKMVAENLELFAEDVDRYIDDKTKQKVSQAVIENHENQLAKAREDAKQVAYPLTIFYPDEKTEIVGLNKEELTAQKAEVKNCGYQVSKEGLYKLVENENLKSQQFVIKKIASYWETKGEHIQRAVKAGFSKNTEAIIRLETKLSKLKGLSLSKDTILQDGELMIALEIDGFMKSDFDTDKKAIEEKKKNMKDLSAEVELLSKNNKMLKLLSSLSANKQVVIEHRDAVIKENVVARCPVCGSESFSTMEEALILKEADEYIKKNGEAVKEKEVHKTSLQSEIENLYQKIINYTKTVVEKEKEALETEISGLKVLKDEIQPYFDAVKILQKSGREINVEELTAEKVGELLAAVEGALLEEGKEQKVKDIYQQILTVLGYEFTNETVQQTYAKVKNLVTRSYEISDFSYDLFVSKINAIDSILANQTLYYLNQKLEADNKKNQILDAEIEELQKLKDSASQRAKDIKDVVEELLKDEYEKVGPTLGKFYNKLIRFNSSDVINIVQENEGISLIDDKGKNLVNVLSNGQISVFMLAHFFAGINARNDCERMKVYFIDDLTACMDDVNMLAFMDLLKYQMSSKATMEQLFFITCDERISKLLKYKISGRGIELCELLEADFM